MTAHKPKNINIYTWKTSQANRESLSSEQPYVLAKVNTQVLAASKTHDFQHSYIYMFQKQLALDC